ncbi:PBP1b-binding outer membrane lipoprotein LpoB [Dysgonomonas sp. PH5-45]|uniref:DUF4878 domain-containing protein n=1 Tax=unclassified Dysgonomonas TaxID=2630389 RepID=UPI0024770787|nr:MULTISPECIES: DUF4878 domain-containing protein [unclassified Dysgonomonas]MDH6354517.1 PBP1b-binding outer membrane lipoprotein LpoB [Dysgonomonas sp. PH5-45]MDH6387427.1 PBP1b-binding outer membrane lipoprotein LpoB [Dysgonomonas sp. PH5-37]
MKKVFNFLAIAVIALLFASCSDNSPAGIEKAIYNQMQKGDFEKAVETMISNMDGYDKDNDKSAEEKAQVIAAFAAKAKQGAEAKGGIKSFEIVNEDIAEDGLTATVSTKVIYGDGSEDTKDTSYIKKDGKWKIKMDK